MGTKQKLYFRLMLVQKRQERFSVVGPPELLYFQEVKQAWENMHLQNGLLSILKAG